MSSIFSNLLILFLIVSIFLYSLFWIYFLSSFINAISYENQTVKVLGVVVDSSAEKAGLKRNDEIVKVNDAQKTWLKN